MSQRCIRSFRARAWAGCRLGVASGGCLFFCIQERHFPQLYDYLERGLSQDPKAAQKRADLKGRLARGLEKAEAKFLEWNYSTWMRPPHLFGLLCNEERRRQFAGELLRLLGHGAQADRELAAATVGQRPGEGISSLSDLEECWDDADRLLLEKLKEHYESGALVKLMQLHGMMVGAALTPGVEKARSSS